MRIAMIVGEFPSITETFVLNQITGLIERGHAVDVYAHFPSRSPVVHQRVHDYRLQKRVYYIPRPPTARWRLRLRGASALATTALKSPTFLRRAFAAGRQLRGDITWSQLCAAGSLLRRAPYDVVHCQFAIYGQRYVGLHKYGALKGRFITSVRGYDVSMHLRQSGRGTYRQLFAAGDLFLPNCEYLKRRIIELGCPKEKIVVLPSGIDCRTFPFSPRQLAPADRVRIVSVGRCVEKKGTEYAIRAVAKLAQEMPRVEHYIIGDGPLRQSLESLISSLGAGASIRMVGPKRQDEVAEILRSSHIVLAPSVTSANGDEEGIPNVLTEGMAMGLPVVSTRHAGIPELVEDGVSGFLVSERDVEALTSRLRFLISRPEIWPAMGRAGRARVEARYNIESLNEQLVDIYRALMVSPPVPRSLRLALPSPGRSRHPLSLR